MHIFSVALACYVRKKTKLALHVANPEQPRQTLHEPSRSSTRARQNGAKNVNFAHHVALPAARRGPWADHNMLDRRLQLYLVGDNLGHHTHDHDQVSAGSSHTACPATHAAHITSLTNLHAGPLLLFAATARITRRRVSTQILPSGARARTRSPSTPATTQPSRRASPQLAPSLASRTMVA